MEAFCRVIEKLCRTLCFLIISCLTVSCGSGRILLEHVGVWRHLHPGMATAVIDRILWRGKAWICEGTCSDEYDAFITFLRVKDCRSTGGAEAEDETASVISRTRVLSRIARH